MTNKAVQLVQLLRSSKREKRLGTVILFVTSRCNAFCQTCFYHAELNQPGDLTFAQIEKISRTMPAITDLWLSGGEPTLRRDLSDIIDLFVSNNGVNRIIIPTNGLIKSRVYEVVDRALGNNPADRSLSEHRSRWLWRNSRSHPRRSRQLGKGARMHRVALSAKGEIHRSFSSKCKHGRVCGKLHRDRDALRVHVGELSSRRAVLQHHSRRNTRGRTDQASAAGSFAGDVRACFEVDEALRRSNVCR